MLTHAPKRLAWRTLILAGLASCGSSSGQTTDAGSTAPQNAGGASATGGAIASGGVSGRGGSAGSGAGGASADGGKGGSNDDAALGGDTGSISDSCPGVPCLGPTASLIASCTPGGTCSEQLMQPGIPNSRTLSCYDNGIKVSWGTDSSVTSLSQGSSKIVKKGASVCYVVSTIEDASSTDASARSETIKITDGTGTLLLTVADRGSSGSTIICPGVDTTLFESKCWGAFDVVYAGILPTPACSVGTCAF